MQVGWADDSPIPAAPCRASVPGRAADAIGSTPRHGPSGKGAELSRPT